MEQNERPLMERLAVAQSIFKIVSAQVKTGDPNNLRGQADAQLMDLFESTSNLGMPVKSMDLTVSGDKVGTVSISKIGSVKTETVYDLVDGKAYEQWLFNNSEDVTLFMSEFGEAFCRWLMSKTGEIPDGISPRTVEVPAKPVTTVRVDPKKVAKALAAEQELPPVLAGLLGGE